MPAWPTHSQLALSILNPSIRRAAIFLKSAWRQEPLEIAGWIYASMTALMSLAIILLVKLLFFSENLNELNHFHVNCIKLP